MYELLQGVYEPSIWETFNFIVEECNKDDEVKSILGEGADTDILRDYVRDMVYDEVPVEYYLNQEVCVDILVDTGAEEYAFTYIRDGEKKEAAIDGELLWLVYQQGYNKTQLKKALARESESKFLKTVVDEILNIFDSSFLTFCVKMTLDKWFDLHDVITAEEDKNPHPSNPRLRTGRKYITLSKDAVCGLFNKWDGSGSLFEIELEKDVKLPIKYIYEALPDECIKYNVMETYGVGEDFWKKTLKEIHPMKKTNKKA